MVRGWNDCTDNMRQDSLGIRATDQHHKNIEELCGAIKSRGIGHLPFVLHIYEMSVLHK